MKKFTINCDFGGQSAPFVIYIGSPEPKHHPLHFQADWLAKQRGGTIPAEVMEAVAKLKDLAEKNKVSLEELCVYAIGSAREEELSPEGDDLAPEGDDLTPEAAPEEGEEEDRWSYIKIAFIDKKAGPKIKGLL